MPGQAADSIDITAAIKAVAPIAATVAGGATSAWSLIAFDTEGMAKLAATAGVAGAIALFAALVGWKIIRHYLDEAIKREARAEKREERMASRIDTLEDEKSEIEGNFRRTILELHERQITTTSENTQVTRELTQAIKSMDIRPN